MKSGFGKLVLFIVSLSALFTYIGIYFLPQSESLPPKVIEIEAGISTDELIKIGEDILFGKGQCMVCHPNQPESGMRAPAIATIGIDVDNRIKEEGLDISNEVYMIQALVDTKAYIPKGYAPIMPPSQKLLNEGELIALTAFLQSKGSDVTVSYPGSVETVQRLMGAKAAPAEAVNIDKGISADELVNLGKDLYADKGGCIECHPAAPDPDIEYPILPDLIKVVEKHAKHHGIERTAFLYEALVNPSAHVADGMDDIMPATQDSLSPDEIVAVAAYLESVGGSLTISLDSLPILNKELEKAGGQ